MSHHLNRQRSATAVPRNTSPNELTTGNRARFHSVSSDVVPQTLILGEDDSILHKTARSPNTHNLPNISNVGFQSIFLGGGQRRSRQSLVSVDEADASEKYLKPSKSHGSFVSTENDDGMKSADALSIRSAFTSSSSLKNRRASHLFIRSKDTTNSGDTSLILGGTSRKKSSASLQQSYKSSESNGLSKVARKLFHRKKNRHDREAVTEQVIPSSLSRFLHPSYLIHKTQSQFIHNANTIIDSGKSVYSFNPALGSSHMDNMTLLNDDYDSSSNSALMLHDLLKNLSSLEANYKNFNMQELTVLSGNVWGVFCNVIIELFKRKRLWQLPAKIEDINRVLEFYAFLKTESRVASPQSTFLNEVEEFISSSLKVLENQIIFNSNENTMNTLLKRLGVIWQVFYQQVYYDVMATLLPLENSFRTHSQYWSSIAYSDSYEIISVDHILLKCFRDCIVLPYYQNFVNRDKGVSKSFQMYIYSEEEENGVTDQDKLTLLQCFGILSTIQGTDDSQKVLEELLEGIRMSI